MDKLYTKINDLKDQRKANAESCAHVISKYQRILDVRLKDSVFQTWLQKLKGEQVLLHNSSFNHHKNYSQHLNFTERDFLSDDSRGDSRSVVSGHFIKSKSIYALKKVFNKNCLKVYFDVFVIKLF